MEDWEEEHVPVVLKKELIKSNWDDEDADDNDVKESWEDEEEEEEEEKPKPAPKDVPKVDKAPKKQATKSSEQKEKKPQAIEVAEDEPPLDPFAEKLRQQRLVEEADFKATTELFAKKGDEKTLDNFIPKSENDFLEYAELISHKLRPYEKSYHYIALLKNVMRLSMTTLKAADAKEIASSVTAIANEKIKAEKDANAGKKKTGAKKKQLIVDKGDDMDVALGKNDVYDDYDFM